MRSIRITATILWFVAAGILSAEDAWKNVDRVVAVGDVHGDYDQFVSVLRAAGIVDASGKWSGGETHLVQTGDVAGRGPDTRKVMDLLKDLEKQARKARGRVHALIANHEAMVMYGDLRYTTAAEFESFGGKTGHRLAFQPEGPYGQWIREHNAIIRINDTVFLHGGISPKYADSKIRQINDAIRAELTDFSKLRGGVTVDPEGPLWYRGLAQEDERTLGAHLDSVLRNLGARRMVIAHTITAGAILPRFGGKLLLIDVALSRALSEVGRPACLILEGGKTYALHRGKKLEIPEGSGKALVPYLREVAALEPKQAAGALEKMIAELE